jgi:effector-binding domain-containing protein
VRDLLPIGAFSKVCRLTIKALRHYDELDLLKPAWVDPESGYRFFSLSQARQATRIGQMRALGLPLDEIRLALGSPQEFRQVVQRHRARVLALMETQQTVLLALEDLLDGKEAEMKNEVLIKEVPAFQILGVRTLVTLAEIPVVFGQIFGELCAYLGQRNVAPAGPPMTIYHDPVDQSEPDRWDMEISIPVSRPLAGQDRMRGHELEQAKVAYTLHEGPYGQSSVSETYRGLMAWIQSQNLRIAGPPREIYLVGPGHNLSPENYRTEIQWPVA